MPTRLRWYVGSLCVAGGFVLAYLMTRLDFVRAREVGSGDRRVRRLHDRRRAGHPPGQRPEPAQGSLHHRHLRLRAGGPGRHRGGRAGVPPWLGHLRPGPAQGRHQDAVQRRPVRARPGRRRGRLPRPRRRLRDHHRHPAGAGGRRARLHADQLPAGQHPWSASTRACPCSRGCGATTSAWSWAARPWCWPWPRWRWWSPSAACCWSRRWWCRWRPCSWPRRGRSGPRPSRRWPRRPPSASAASPSASTRSSAASRRPTGSRPT